MRVSRVLVLREKLHIMNNDEQVDALVVELDKLISRYRAEFDLNLHSIVGVLEEKKMSLLLGEEMLHFESEIELDDDDEELEEL